MPDLRIASAASLNSRLLTKFDRLVERVVVSEAVDEEEIEVVGSHVGQALVELAHDLGRGLRQILGDHEDLLANLGLLLEPELEVGLGLVPFRGVEAADALGVGVPQNALNARSLAGARVKEW